MLQVWIDIYFEGVGFDHGILNKFDAQ